MEEPISFGYWVRRRRKALDLTQGDLARRVGCAEVTIQKIEADERRPSRQIAELLADQLAVAADERAIFLLSARGELPADHLAAAAPAEELAGDGVRPVVLAQHDAHAHDPRPRNLPGQLTSFVGREHELATAVQLLASARLLTLTGPGGTGKTRLAIQLAFQIQERFTGGVWLVDLAPLADPDLVLPAVAAALHVREEPTRPLLATLTTYLQERRLLLLLDNCEHLIDACAQLAEALLHGCPGLQIVASSREPLGIGGEAVLRVPPLALPEPGTVLPLDRLAHYEAIRLFVERARAAQPAFELTDANAGVVVQICQRLDGIPLAIELAAARVRVLAVEQIAARLDDRFRLLTGGSRTALPRHQTLQALIDWSYDLLDEAERALLRRLAVFVGDWTLEAAEAIHGEASGLGFEALGSNVSPSLKPQVSSLIDLLTQLVDKSLVQVDYSGDESRYHLLETIRQYALEKLADSGEADAVRERYAAYYLALAEAAEDESPTARSGQLEAAHDNLRAALIWSETAEHGAEIGLRLARALTGFWMLGGYWTEARSWLAGALAHSQGQERTHLQAEVLLALGTLHVLQSDYEAGQAVFSRCLDIYEELGDESGRTWTLNRLGWAAREQGDLASARDRLEESLRLYRELGDKHGVLEGLNALAEVASLQEDARWAADLLAESQALALELGDTYAYAWALNHRGHVAQLDGDYAHAAELHQESLAVFLEHGEQHLGTAWARHGLAECALLLGSLDSARPQFAAALSQFRDLGDQAGVIWCLVGLAGVAAAAGEPARAARLWGAAEAWREAIGARLATATRAPYERAVADARACIAAEEFDAAWAEGRALPLERAIGEALEAGA